MIGDRKTNIFGNLVRQKVVFFEEVGPSAQAAFRRRAEMAIAAERLVATCAEDIGCEIAEQMYPKRYTLVLALCPPQLSLSATQRHMVSGSTRRDSVRAATATGMPFWKG